jgi:topoisomerase-4 subunit A
MGEPVRTMLDLEDSAGIVFLNVFTAKDSFFLASKSGRGFVVLAENILATKRSGKQVLNLANDDQAKICLRVTGEYIAVINTEKRLLVFSVSELPELTKGKGVILLKNKTGHLADATIFQETSSFQWLVKPNNAIRTCKDFSLWVGRRGTRGKTVPKGFPKNLMFAASCNINTEQH